MKKLVFSIGMLLIISILFSSCATISNRGSHPLYISSKPNGAHIIVNGVRMGSTPEQINLKADKTYTIEIKKDNYYPVTRYVNSKVGGRWIVVNIMFGVWPLFVDAATGAWYQLDEYRIHVNLDEEK